MKDLIRTLFTPEELAVYANVFPDGVDVEGLKKLGTVTITDTDQDNIILKRIDFTSFDGSITFTKERSIYKYKAETQKITDFKQAIAKCVAEDTGDSYRRAARLKAQMDTLLLTL